MNHIFFSLGVFLLGILLVVKGGDFFVDAAIWLASALGIPPFVIGATVVSLATTLPEMLVSLLASLEGRNQIAVGNAVGSVIANTGLILAIPLIVLPLSLSRREYAAPCGIFCAAALILRNSAAGCQLRTSGCVLLFLLFILFLYWNLKNAPGESLSRSLDKKQLPLHILYFLLGAAGIVTGSRLLIHSGSGLAAALGISERIIAVTMIAIGTSLPELVTTVSALLKKEAQLSLGNVIGASILDLCLILPVCNLASGKSLPIPADTYILDLPVCLGIFLFFAVPTLLLGKTHRFQGIAMLLSYGYYLLHIL